VAGFLPARCVTSGGRALPRPLFSMPDAADVPAAGIDVVFGGGRCLRLETAE
jgi:hypothetical protein